MVNEEDVLLCTVERIEGTTVFVRLSSGEQGTIVTSEIAPGRIRNLRVYVVPNKKIVCKVLKSSGNHIELSLRRVSAKEKKEVMEKYKQEQTAKSAIKSILKNKAEEVQEKISKDFSSFFDFLKQAKENPAVIEKYIPKEYYEQIKKLVQKKKKEVEIKKIIKMKCLEDDGIKRVKKIFSEKNPNLKAVYISAGNFQLTLKDEDYKKANQKMQEITENIKNLSKENKCELEIVDK